MIKLSDRLLCMAECVKSGEAVADIGTDHGLLPIFLYEQKRSLRLILCDINEGPLKKAEENVSRFLGKELMERTVPAGNAVSCKKDVCRKEDVPFGEEGGSSELPDSKHISPFSLRLGDGLTPLKAREVQAVIIAGMGGILISDILQADIEKARSFSRLILQPRNHSSELRQWLHKSKFEIYQEFLVREGIYICEVICARPRGDLELSEPLQSPERSGMRMSCESRTALDFEISPHWIGQKDPLLGEFLIRKIHVERKIIAKIEEAQEFGPQGQEVQESGAQGQEAQEFRSQQDGRPLREKKLRQARLRLKLLEGLYLQIFGASPRQREEEPKQREAEPRTNREKRT